MSQKVMIFERNQQTLTRRNENYIEEEFAWLQPKREILGSWNYLGGEL